MTALPDRAKASPDVEDVVQRLIVASGIGKSSADNENYVANASIKDCDDAIATIRTLTARAEAAEARAETARAEALEEAAKLAETPSGINRGRENARGKAIAKYIRALRTAPPPTAKGII
jgi:ribosomal protein L12E/L44/L45/RPP1/RPP2